MITVERFGNATTFYASAPRKFRQTAGGYQHARIGKVTLLYNVFGYPERAEDIESKMDEQITKEEKPILMILSEAENISGYPHVWKGAEVVSTTRNVRTGHNIKILRWA